MRIDFAFVRVLCINIYYTACRRTYSASLGTVGRGRNVFHLSHPMVPRATNWFSIYGASRETHMCVSVSVYIHIYIYVCLRS